MLQHKFKTEEEIPEQIRDLYTHDEIEGEWVLEGLVPKAELDKVMGALIKERAKNKPQSRKSQTDQEPRHDPVGDPLANAPANYKAQIENERKAWERDRQEIINERDQARRRAQELQIETALVQAARKHKITDTAIKDLAVIAKNEFQITDDHVHVRADAVEMAGAGIDEWIKAQKTERPHWWSPSVGAGTRGESGAVTANKHNPFKTGNLTEQSLLYKEDAELARQMAKEAGVELFE